MVKKLIPLTLMLMFNTQSWSEDDFAKSLAQQADHYKSDPAFAEQLKNPSLTQQMEEAYSFGQLLHSQQQAAFSPVEPVIEANDSIRYEVLISDEMGIDKIRDILGQIAGSGYPVTFYLKGFLPTEKTFNDVFRRAASYVQGIEPVPSIQLDPDRFEHIDTVPLTKMVRGDKTLLSVHGVINPSWLSEQYETGKRGYQDKQGETFTVTEISPTVIAMERAKGLDAQAIIQRAKDNYWKQVRFESVPNSYKTQQRIFVPEIMTPNLITTPDGKVIAHAGQYINLLDRLPFTSTLIVFDATDPRQLDFVKTIDNHRSSNAVLVTSKLNRDRKWEAVNDIESQLKNNVFLLNSDIVNGFDIQAVPSVITADNDAKHFVIQEFDVRDMK